MSYEAVAMKLRSVPEQYLEQISFIIDSFLRLKQNDEQSVSQPSGHPIFGLAKGEFRYPDNINLGDDEISEMFEV